MDPLFEILQTLPSFLLAVVIQYRLPRKVLIQKWSDAFTFFIMFAVNFFASWLNISIELTMDFAGNAFYYGLINLILYLWLFKGSFIKKVFLTVLISCGLPIPFYCFLPFVYYFFPPETQAFSVALNVISMIHTILTLVVMEYIGKRFQYLRRELPFGYTIYLTAVILFLFVAVYSAYDRMIFINKFVVTLSTAFAMSLFALAGAAIVFVAIFAVDRQVSVSLKEQLHTLQTKNFKNRELEWHRFSGFRHDIKNHLICLSRLLENKKPEQAAAYMRNLMDTLKEFDSPVQTGNDYADALLSVKYAEAAAAKIAISMELAIPSNDFMDPVDLCCILSNAFDNAIAACHRLPENERWITARGFVKQGQLVFIIKNSKPSYIKVIDGDVFPKEISSDHGLGLETVRTVVQKYGGVLQLSAEDAFSFSVLLPQIHS